MCGAVLELGSECVVGRQCIASHLLDFLGSSEEQICAGLSQGYHYLLDEFRATNVMREGNLGRDFTASCGLKCLS